MALIPKGPFDLAPGKWWDLEVFYGKVSKKTVGYFQVPAGATIRVRYGSNGWFGFSKQTQTLDGATVKNLTVSGWVGYARMQVKVLVRTQFSYELETEGP